MDCTFNMQNEPSPELCGSAGIVIIADAGLATEDGAVLQTEIGQDIQPE